MSPLRIAIVGGVLSLVACSRAATTAGPIDVPAPVPPPAEDSGSTAPPALDEPEAPARIECGEATCTAPEQCISHPAMGPSGPTVAETCGVPCDPALQNADCPAGKHCVPIADGPGPVCR